MSVVQSFSESLPAADIAAWAHANPTMPRVIGIDVGQDKLAVWFGAPNPDALATDAASMRFIYFAWVLCRCGATATNKQACDVVTRVLDSYAAVPFGMASDIVIEKQHKKNGRMRAIAAAIRQWALASVPNARRMRIVDRQALSKFATIVQMPCPMPREYADRKKASERVVGAQVRNWAGSRWFHFYQRHAECADDLADATLIAQDYMITVYPTLMVAPDSLSTVFRLIAQRRARNSWRKQRKLAAASRVTDDFANEFTAYLDDDGDTHDRGKRSASSRLDEYREPRVRQRMDPAAAAAADDYEDLETLLV